MGLVWLPLFLLILQLKGSLLLGTNDSDSCGTHTNCNDCIRNPDICVWCAMENFQGSRCMKPDINSRMCPGMLQNPTNKITVGDNEDFSSDLRNIIQIRPQRYKMELRTRVPIDFTFSFKAASDYPVDLYFLLDTSVTMENIRNTIQKQSQVIYDTMKNLTQNVQFGMGTFVDKNALPFTNQTDSEKTYSFRHQLKLTEDADMFKKTITNAKFGYNFDTPEGGLDALAQVLKCRNIIDWRNGSRKMIVFLTDATYHVAGDGMIGGIFTPYDGRCYTNSSGFYINELKMDYPSVSVINKLATDEEITVIFLVKNEVKNLYSHLSEAISGSQCVSYDSGHNNVAEILTKIYTDITRAIKLKANFRSGAKGKFDITFNPDCTADNSGNNPKCSIKKGEEIEITGTLTLLKDYETNNTKVDVLIEGINEKLSLDINILRNCECEKKAEINSGVCTNGGTFKCGICECNSNRYGERCACIANSKTGRNVNSTCIMQGDRDLCHGRGTCVCGQCYCGNDTPYEGPYCQFNKDNCPRFNNTVCNGRGSCVNEQCKCTDEGWEGDACECPKSDSLCMRDGKVCNNMGKCQCGKCVCQPTAVWDARTKDSICNILPCQDCHKPQCDRLYSCAQCLLSREECSNCEPFKASVSEYTVSSDNVTWFVCPDISVNVGCYTRFMYRYSTHKYLIEMVVQGKANCLKSYYMFGAVCLGLLILLGLSLVAAWKCGTYFQDRREYERFIKEHAEDGSQVCSNPTYRAASTTIANPVFRKPSVDIRN